MTTFPDFFSILADCSFQRQRGTTGYGNMHA